MSEAAYIVVSNPLATRLRNGELGLVLHVKQVRTINIAIAAKTCGYDAIYLDMQHTAISDAEVADISVAALANGVCPLVRVAGHNYGDALRLLDSGAYGIVIPEVTTAAQARKAVEYCRFAPIGKRSAAGAWPQFGYGAIPATQARKILNEQTLLVAMIESEDGLRNVDEIAAVEGIDIIHMGSNDIASDLGFPGELDNPVLEDVFQKLVAACRRHNKIPGLGGMSGNPQLVGRFVKLGARFLTGANEWSLMMGAAKARAELLRALPLV